MNLDREMSFKGGRTYLHSTTVFDDLVRLRNPGAGAIDFRFDRRTDRQVRYQFEPPASGTLPVATWRDQEGTIYIVERGEAITGSVPYDEDGLANRFRFTGQSVTLPVDLDGNSLIEAVVAGFKALLQRTVADKASKLAFVRLRLSRLPTLPLEIRFSRRIGEFYQGDIHAGAEPVGQIFFGEWK